MASAIGGAACHRHRAEAEEASAPPAGATVLVSGASFAGLATAYCMNRLGYGVTVIEMASFQEYDHQLRPSVGKVQERAVRFGMALMFPSDDAEIAARNRQLSEGTIDL